MNWYPHVTVSTIVEKDGLFLMVEENKHGRLLLNQPAGHLEKNESLFAAAIRETLEETQWRIELLGVLGNSLFTSPTNNTTYLRVSFVARALKQELALPLDTDIERAIWMSENEIRQQVSRLRSPMVIHDIERFNKGTIYPLELIQHL
ncbi:NUDIX hydrolase [Teredinibacter franksiae]|uniref:NUDIX hydrolase n=1 Tax=Teredinibacter franksiae TaxID=2761453 RepID=UPI001628F4C3|nr:NUDIX hydrolase [Teredinibacter franksiae]